MIRMGWALLFMTLASCASLSSGGVLTEDIPLRMGSESLSLQEVLAEDELHVLVWWSGTCPCVKRYEERVEALKEAWPDFQFYYVSSNAGDEKAMQEAYTGSLPMIRDEGGRLAALLEVRSTPSAVVIDREGKLLYRGWIDNERKPGDAGRKAWLEEKLQSLKDGERAFSQKPVWGCSITRSLSDPGHCDG